MRGGRVGRGALRRVLKVVGSERRVSPGTLKRVESDSIAELGDSNNGRVILLDKFPET